jgi:hypothetical protein
MIELMATALSVVLVRPHDCDRAVIVTPDIAFVPISRFNEPVDAVLATSIPRSISESEITIFKTGFTCALITISHTEPVAVPGKLVSQ